MKNSSLSSIPRDTRRAYICFTRLNAWITFKIALRAVPSIPNHSDLFRKRKPLERLNCDSIFPFFAAWELRQSVARITIPSSRDIKARIWTEFATHLSFLCRRRMDCEDGSASTKGIEGERRRRRRQLKKMDKVEKIRWFLLLRAYRSFTGKNDKSNLKNSDLREEEGLNVYDLWKNRFEKRTNINFTRNNFYIFLKYL